MLSGKKILVGLGFVAMSFGIALAISSINWSSARVFHANSVRTQRQVQTSPSQVQASFSWKEYPPADCSSYLKWRSQRETDLKAAPEAAEHFWKQQPEVCFDTAGNRVEVASLLKPDRH